MHELNSLVSPEFCLIDIRCRKSPLCFLVSNQPMRRHQEWKTKRLPASISVIKQAEELIEKSQAVIDQSRRVKKPAGEIDKPQENPS
jgi:hypothetical protein